MRPSLLLVAALLFIALVPQVEAHANYYRSEPPRGARLAQAPSLVSVTLSEGVDPEGSSLQVRDAHGQRVDEGEMRFEGGATPVLSVDLPSDLPAGAYQARWHALSKVDGHVTSGTFGFAVGGFEPPSDVAQEFEYDAGSAVARFLAYAGYALGFGALAFAFYVDPNPRGHPLSHMRGRVLSAAGLLLFLGTAVLFLSTWQKSTLALGVFGQTGVGTEFALRLAVAASLLVVGCFAWTKGLAKWILVTCGVLLVGGAIGNSAYAHSAEKGWWASAVDLLHLVSVSVWLGGLILFLHFILVSSRDGTYDDVVRVGRRFSTVALASVFVLGSTGLLSTFLILGIHPFRSPLALMAHPYGTFLGAKILLFLAMIGLAGINRFIFLGARPGPDRAPSPRTYESLRPSRSNRGRVFARAVGLEATLGLAVLVLAGFLTAMSPPSTLAAQGPDDSLQRIGFGQEHNVTLRIDPRPTSGNNSNVSLIVHEAGTGRPLGEAIRIRVTIARADGNESGGESYTATSAGGGRWLIGDVLFVQAGAHEARVEIQTETVYRDTLTIPFEVAA